MATGVLNHRRPFTQHRTAASSWPTGLGAGRSATRSTDASSVVAATPRGGRQREWLAPTQAAPHGTHTNSQLKTYYYLATDVTSVICHVIIYALFNYLHLTKGV